MAVCTNGRDCWGTSRPLASWKKFLARRKLPMQLLRNWRLPTATKKLWANATKRDVRTNQSKVCRVCDGVSARLNWRAASGSVPCHADTKGPATAARRLPDNIFRAGRCNRRREPQPKQRPDRKKSDWRPKSAKAQNGNGILTAKNAKRENSQGKPIRVALNLGDDPR